MSLFRSVNIEGWPSLIAAGAVAQFFSQPVVFVLAAIGAATVLDRRFRSSPIWRRYSFLAAFVWLAVFGLLFWFSYRHTAHSTFMRAFWAPRFIHLGTPTFWKDTVLLTTLLLGDPEAMRFPLIILLPLFVTGVYGIARNQGMLVTILAAGPFVLVLAAAATEQYPVVPRLALFIAPMLCWIYASSVVTLSDLFPRKISIAAFLALSGIFLFTVSRDAVWNARHVIAKEGTRDIASKIEASPDRALVYILFGRYAQWGYYAADWEHPDTVKYRVDTAFDCLRNAQLGYISGRDARTAKCSGLDFPPTPGRKQEIVGNCPPGPQAGAMADDQWAAEEAARIEAAKSPSVWLFLPDAASHFINGFPMRRKLLEKLESRLEPAAVARSKETGRAKPRSTSSSAEIGQSHSRRGKGATGLSGLGPDGCVRTKKIVRT